MRHIVLDTETTGLEPAEGHRIIEIGAIEMMNRRPTGRRYHQYLNPERAIDAAASEIHGITMAMLVDKPHFSDVAVEFLTFVDGAELLIHNAAFDVGFINAELQRAIAGGLNDVCERLDEVCTIVDTLKLARSLHPGQKNSLDALCKRYGIDNSHRVQHGALLDAEILVDVYLAMTGGQAALFDDAPITPDTQHSTIPTLVRGKAVVIHATPDEIAAHEAYMDVLDRQSGGRCLWKLIGK